MTHNQPPYRSAAKLDCIQRLVIRPDLANVSHSSPEPRQLCVIRAGSGLPLLPLRLPSLQTLPSAAFPRFCRYLDIVSGEEATKGLLTRSLGPPPFPPHSQVLFQPPASLGDALLNATPKFPQDKSLNALLKPGPIVDTNVGRNRSRPLCDCC